MTKRDHLVQVYENTGVIPKELESPDIPETYEDALELYWQLRSGESLTYNEVLAYVELTGVIISLSEAEKLMIIDRIVRKLLDRLNRGRRGKEHPDS